MRCSPTLGGETSIPHEYLKRFPFGLMDSSKPEDTGDDESAALEDENDQVKNEKDVPFFNKREMKSQGADLVQVILKTHYRQGWDFLTNRKV